MWPPLWFFSPLLQNPGDGLATNHEGLRNTDQENKPGQRLTEVKHVCVVVVGEVVACLVVVVAGHVHVARIDAIWTGE